MSESFGRFVNSLPIHESSTRGPTLCPLVSNDLHWTEIQTTGLTSWPTTFRKFLKFVLFGTIAGGGIIGAYLSYDNKAEVELMELSGKDADLFRATCKVWITSLIGSSCVFFGLAQLRNISMPLLRHLVITSNQIKFAPLAWLIEFNIIRGVIGTALISYFTTQTSLYNHRYENYVLAGSLGAVLGTVFCGFHLCRFRSPLAVLGPLGFIGGLAGFTCFREFSSLSKDALLVDNNRHFWAGLVAPLLPYILLGITYAYFLAGFQEASVSHLFGSQLAGGFTGGYIASIISQNKLQLKTNYENLFNSFSSL